LVVYAREDNRTNQQKLKNLSNPIVLMDQKLDKFLSMTNLSFSNRRLLSQAFTHRSYAFECNDGEGDNERLEFLGDAVIGFCVTEKLYRLYPDYNEGQLSILKSCLISKKFLAGIGSEISLGEYLNLGVGEDKTGGRQRKTLLGDVMEALVGAVFLDGGYEKASCFIWGLIEPKLKSAEQNMIEQNYKHVLQVHSQKNYGEIPVYKLKSKTGPRHKQKYTMQVLIENKVVGMGCDTNKKSAGAKAACEALKRLGIN